MDPIEQKVRALTSRLQGIPSVKDGDPAAKEYALKVCDNNNTYRNGYRRRQLIRMARNLSYYSGQHAINVTALLQAVGETGYVFQPLKGPGGRQLAVLNLVRTAVDNEVARLGRSKYEPHVRPEKLIPEIQKAAKRAEVALKDSLDQQQWPAVRYQLEFDSYVGGTAILRSGWREVASTPIRLPHTDGTSARCVNPACGARFGSRVLSEQDAQAIQAVRSTPQRIAMGGDGEFSLLDQGAPDEAPARGPISMEQADDGSYHLRQCPLCEGALTDETFMGADLDGKDSLGRPMGRDIPRGEPSITACSPFGIFPQNGGFHVEPDTNKVWGRQSVEDIYDLAARFPHLIDYLEVGNPMEMIRLHPSWGERGVDLAAPSLYPHHTILTEVVVEPFPLPGLEKGRLIQVVCDQVAYNGPLMEEIKVGGETRLVPRAWYGAARYTRKPGEFWGRTPIDDMVPVNYEIDKLWTMYFDIVERGKPFLALPEGAKLDFPRSAQGALGIARIGNVGGPIDIRSAIVNGQPLTGNAYLPAMNALIQYAREIGGPKPVEMSLNAPGNKTAQQLQIQAEEAKVVRGPAESSLVDLYKRGWKASLSQLGAFQQVQKAYTVTDEAEVEEEEMFAGPDLLGQCDVDIDEAGAKDESLYQAARTEQALQQGWYGDISTDEEAQEEIFEILGVPKVKGRASVQVQRAEEAWTDFVRTRTVLVVDELLDNPGIFFNVLGRWWKSDDAVRIQKNAGWLAVLPLLSGWQRHLADAEKQDAAQRAIYEGQDPGQWQAIYQEAQQHVQAMTKIARAAPPGVQAPPPPPMPPAPPTDGNFLPEALQARVLRTMQGMVPAIGATPDLVPQEAHGDHAAITEDTRKCLEFYAALGTYSELIKRQTGAMPVKPGTPQAGPSAPVAA